MAESGWSRLSIEHFERKQGEAETLVYYFLESVDEMKSRDCIVYVQRYSSRKILLFVVVILYTTAHILEN